MYTDKEKLLELAKQLEEIEMPDVKSPEAKDALIDAMNHLSRAYLGLEDFCK